VGLAARVMAETVVETLPRLIVADPYRTLEGMVPV
jgi:hypothetical protein